MIKRTGRDRSQVRTGSDSHPHLSVRVYTCQNNYAGDSQLYEWGKINTGDIKSTSTVPRCRCRTRQRSSPVCVCVSARPNNSLRWRRFSRDEWHLQAQSEASCGSERRGGLSSARPPACLSTFSFRVNSVRRVERLSSQLHVHGKLRLAASYILIRQEFISKFHDYFLLA